MCMHLPDNELIITFIRSSGKGGQHVNKVATKAVVRWNILRSRVFSGEQKAWLSHRLKNKVTSSGDIIVTADAQRSQEQNKTQALLKLDHLVTAALRKPKPRTQTKPTRASRERRLASKQKHGNKKALRRIINEA